jgi:hypothetical protein
MYFKCYRSVLKYFNGKILYTDQGQNQQVTGGSLIYNNGALHYDSSSTIR